MCCCTSKSPTIWAPIEPPPFDPPSSPRFNEKKQRKKLPKRRKETRSISDFLCKWPVMINQKNINNIVKLAKFWSFLNVLKTVRLPLELAPYFNNFFPIQEMEYYLWSTHLLSSYMNISLFNTTIQCWSCVSFDRMFAYVFLKKQ